MIKFWKSAAKGKSGCPVRPPEYRTLYSETNTPLELESEIECENIFEKKSKLSITLQDILFEKKSIKYFLLFMEATGKHPLVKCWLELDNFKTQVSFHKLNEDNKHIQLIRTKSFDIQCSGTTQKQDEDSISHKFRFRSSECSIKLNELSTSSCENLAKQTSFSGANNPGEKTSTFNAVDEAISLFKKYVALEAPNKLLLPDDLRKLVISNICQPEGQLKENCFEPVQEVLFQQMETHFSEFRNSPLYIKAQIDILTTDSIDLADILYNDTILFYFTEYLEQESCSILLEFLISVAHFRNNITKNNNDISAEQMQGDAIILYEKYFSLQATNPVGFPTEVRLKVESDICAEGGPLATSFDIPFKIIFKTLSKYVKTFLESELYYSYLSEMVHSVDRLWSSKFKSHSDCSSEFSISTQNTLLAMGDPHFKKKRNYSVPDMSIDSNQLYNADALWQRKKHDGLSLGRINSLGRFESKFEPDPDKKDKSVLKKMVSKLVPISTSKVEEEMAWQIAHMIVKDVTDLTMAPPDHDNGDV